MSGPEVSGTQYFYALLLTITLMWLLKIVVFVLGYKVVAIGARLLEQGVKGEFKFKSSYSGAKADLQSTSPGTLFTLLGVAIIIAALAIRIQSPFKQTSTEQKPAAVSEPVLPKNPFPEEPR